MGGDLDNPDRGIFHIEGAEFWEFYDLELINGPYGIYSRDSSNNYYERLITRDNYESGSILCLLILCTPRIIDRRADQEDIDIKASNSRVMPRTIPSFTSTLMETAIPVKTAKALMALRARRDLVRAMFSVVQGCGTTLMMVWICGGLSLHSKTVSSNVR